MHNIFRGRPYLSIVYNTYLYIGGHSLKLTHLFFILLGNGEILRENIYNLYITFNIKEYVQSNKRKNKLLEKLENDMKQYEKNNLTSIVISET